MILSYDVIAAKQSDSDTELRTAFVLHGILGSGRNWRTMARKLARNHPTWRFVLVDLRNHGDSHPAPAPHTLDACAADLVDTARSLSAAPEVVIGHSFGGKVALAYGRMGAEGLRAVLSLDAIPGPLPAGASAEGADDVHAVMRALRELPQPIDSYEALRDALAERGFSAALASWMTTNLERRDSGFFWRFDLDAAATMLSDYAATDFWPWLDDPGIEVHILRAGLSDRWSEADVDRLAELDSRGAIHSHLLANAGHWVHADDPSGTLEAIAQALT